MDSDAGSTTNDGEDLVDDEGTSEAEYSEVPDPNDSEAAADESQRDIPVELPKPVPHILERLFEEDPESGRQLIQMLLWSGRLPPPQAFTAYPQKVQDAILAEFESRNQAAEAQDVHERSLDQREIALREKEAGLREKGLDADIKVRPMGMGLVAGCFLAALLTIAFVAYVGFSEGAGTSVAIVIVALAVLAGIVLIGLGSRGMTPSDREGVEAQRKVAETIRSAIPWNRGKDEPAGHKELEARPEPPTDEGTNA